MDERRKNTELLVNLVRATQQLQEAVRAVVEACKREAEEETAPDDGAPRDVGADGNDK